MQTRHPSAGPTSRSPYRPSITTTILTFLTFLFFTTSLSPIQATPPPPAPPPPNDPIPTFEESLYVEPLRGDLVLAQFEFVTTERRSGLGTTGDHYAWFPRTVAHAIDKHGVNEVDVSLSRGRWLWGEPVVETKPSGLHVWARFEDAGRADTQWPELTNTLSGLLCASINFLTPSITAVPTLIPPHSTTTAATKPNPNDPNDPNKAVRVGTLPREGACTGNLTPWLKLSPSRNEGLARLVRPRRVFDSAYHSIRLFVRKECVERGPAGKCEVFEYSMVQSLTSVLAPGEGHDARDWSLTSLLSSPLLRGSPLASSSTLILSHPTTGVRITPTPHATSASLARPGTTLSLWNLLTTASTTSASSNAPPDAGFDVTYRRLPNEPLSWTPAPSLVGRYGSLHIDRYISSASDGNKSYKLVTVLKNDDPEQERRFRYMEIIPWYMRLYLHTFSAMVNGTQPATIHRHILQIASDRVRPYVIELESSIPPRSTWKSTVSFEKGTIWFTEHRPDAERGIDVPGAAVAFEKESRLDLERYEAFGLRQYGATTNVTTTTTTDRTVFTNSLLLALHTPDLSMPYNVITLTCTALALFVGSMFNLMTRRMVPMPRKTSATTAVEPK